MNWTVFHLSPALSALQCGWHPWSHLCTCHLQANLAPLSFTAPTRTCYLLCIGRRHSWHIEWWIHVILLQVLICIQLLFLRLATLITARTARRINARRLSLSRNRNGETTVIMLLEMHFSPNNHHLPFSQVSALKRWKRTAWSWKCAVALFCDSFFQRSHFIRVPIPSAPNKWTAFSDTKLIARVAMGCHAGQALLSQWKCNLCGANEEELPCDDSCTQRRKEHVALKKKAPRFDKQQASHYDIMHSVHCEIYFLL